MSIRFDFVARETHASSRTLAGLCSSASGESRHIALLEDQEAVIDRMTAFLSAHAPEHEIIACSRIDDLSRLTPSLIVVCGEDNRAPWRELLAKTDQIYERMGPVPVVAFVEDMDSAKLQGFAARGHSVLPTSLNGDLARAWLQVVLSGGRFCSFDHLHRRATFAREDRPNALAAAESELQKRDIRQLTRREEDIVRYVQRGISNKIIAYELGISICTVKVHLQNIMKKLKVTNRTQVAFLASRASSSTVETLEDFERSSSRLQPADPRRPPSNRSASARP